MNADARDYAAPSTDAPFVSFSREETVLAVLPFFSLEYGHRPRSYHLTYETKLSSPGVNAALSWQVSADPSYGYPDAFDRKVFKALEYLGLSTGRPVQNPVRFSLHQVLQHLGLAPFPSHLARARSSIRRIAAVTVQSRLSYETGERAGKATQTFHLYDTVSFNDAAEHEEVTTDDHWVVFGAWYLQTLNHDQIAPLDAVYFRQLRHPIATRLYELLTVKFAAVLRDRLSGWRVTYVNLCRILPAAPVMLSPQRHLDVGHQPLIATGFLANVVWEKVDGVWMILYTPGPRAQAMYEPAPERRPRLFTQPSLALPAAGQEEPPEPTRPPVLFFDDPQNQPATAAPFEPSPFAAEDVSPDDMDAGMLSYWGLSEHPFDTTPNPKFFFTTRQHKAALFKLRRAVTTCAGAVQLVGDVGCGKTVLIRAFIHSLDPRRYEIALLTNPRWDGVDLLREVLYQLGHPADATDKNHILRHIETLWLNAFQAGKHTALIIDEAQLIADSTAFEELRLLLNFQMDDRNLVTLILAGQPELTPMIQAIPQFEQRMVYRHHLHALSDPETAHYILHRLKVAGATHRIFSDIALQRVFALTGGVPRRINTLCNMALIEGWNQNAAVIEAELVVQAAQG